MLKLYIPEIKTHIANKFLGVLNINLTFIIKRIN